MKNYKATPKFWALLLFACITNYSFAQTAQRIYFTTITSSINTGMDLSSWLNDSVTVLVPNDWAAVNMQYVDVTLTLQAPSTITSLSLYDGEGTFDSQPDTFYAVNGTQKTFLGTFSGDLYDQWVNINLPQPVNATAIIVHKYGNNIPQKIFIYGTVDTGQSTTAPVDSSTTSVAPPTDTVVTATPTTPSTPVQDTAAGWNYGSSTSTGMAPATPAITDSAIIQIPIDGNRWYQLNNVSNGLQGLFDGDTTTAVNTGYGLVLTNFDAYYPVANDEAMDIYQIKLYSGQGNFASTPMTLYGIDSAGNKTLIATFTGGQYDTWVGPTGSTTNFTLGTAMRHIRWLDLNSSGNYPTEIRFYGIYKAGASPTPPTPKSVKLSQMFGVNAFAWDFLNPDSANTLNAGQMQAAKSFTQVRDYLDWGDLEVTQGKYTFNPSHNGSWDYDTLYQSLNQRGIEVLADIKTQPQWMINTYPSAEQNTQNVPVEYSSNYDSNYASPNSYILQAKLAFQFAARYGHNKNVNPSLQSVDNSVRWVGDPANTVKTGMGVINYMECDNERDKWWFGRQAYQTAYEYAANLSAFYDGNKNTMGPGVGVKNADSTMKVVMCGVALPTTDYIRGMVDWCKLHRGYKADGTVNLCWDAINYHFYSNNTGTSQSGNPTAGAAPENSGTAAIVQSFMAAVHQYIQDMPVWVTELGYDLNQASPLHATPIGAKSALQVQGDWILRSALLYARSGVQRIFSYEMFDDDSTSSVKFSSSGLINSNNTRRPAADYMYQANQLLGAYTYSSTISTSPFVDIYTLNGNNAYVLTMPTENGSTASYVLNLKQADSAMVYTPAIGQNSMSVQKMKIVNGQLALTVTETPIFVIPFGSAGCFTPTAGSGGAVCEGSTLSLTSTTTANATFSWSGPNGFTSTLQNPTIPAAIAADSGLYTVTLTVNGCASTDSVDAMVNHQPVLTINAPAAICAPAAINITTSSVISGSTLPSGTTLNYYTDAAGTVSLANPNAITASGTYYIKAIVPAGCSAIKPVTATINPLPTFTSSAVTTCAANTLSYSIAISVSAGTLTSDVGTVTNPSANNWMISSIPAGTNANLLLTNVGGCTNSLMVSAPNCACPFIGVPTSGGDQTQCAQTFVQTITATATAPTGYSVRWFNAATGGTSVTNPVLASVGTITYYAEAYDSASPTCGSSRTAVTLTINPQPVLTISNPATVCAPATVDITTSSVTTGSTLPSGTTLNYYIDTAGTMALANPNAVTASGTYYIKAIVPTGCSAIKAVTVTINPQPVLTISNPAAICAPATVDITASSVTTGSTLPSGTTFNYYTDTAGTMVLANPNAVTVSGTYYIKAVAPAGCSAIKAAIVTINPQPVLTISNPAATCAPATIDLTATAITAGSTLPSGTTLNYYTNVAGTVSLVNPNAITASGTFYIKAQTIAGCSAMQPVTLTINLQPTISVTATNPSTCNGTDGAFTISGLTASSSYTINYNKAGIAQAPQTLTASSTGTITIISLTSGTYTNITAATNTGCLSTNSGNATLTDPAAPAVNASVTGSICDGSTLTLNVNATQGATYSWTGPNSYTSNQQNPTVTNATSNDNGTYAVTVAVNGCSNNSTVLITVNPAPSLDINSPAAVCAPATVDLTTAAITNGSSIAGSSLSYFEDAALTTPLTNPATVATGGTYYIEASNGSGCSVVKPVTVTFTPPPAAPISGGDQIVCIQNLTPTLTATASPAATTVWYNSPTGTTVVNPVWNSIGSVTYYAESNVLGCTSANRTAVKLTIVSPPLVSVDQTNVSVSEGSTIELTANVSTATPGDVPTYSWITDYNISSLSALTTTVSPNVDTTYIFEAASSLLPGCTATATVQVTVVQPLSSPVSISIPNAFSPNGDGIHDTWYIQALEQYPHAEVMVFDRYGNMVFRSNGNYLEAPWNGTYDGHPLPAGPYYYIIRLNPATAAGSVPYTGYVTIIR